MPVPPSITQRHRALRPRWAFSTASSLRRRLLSPSDQSPRQAQFTLAITTDAVASNLPRRSRSHLARAHSDAAAVLDLSTPRWHLCPSPPHTSSP
ncbi:hypothetical protein M0R45_036738 [Rubus argutus]|uniref:Uncharacterized protein n=1 Tax=Rubus argutus TaxID=59490 RepID=A0AAW1VYR2_RUBAR